MGKGGEPAGWLQLLGLDDLCKRRQAAPGGGGYPGSRPLQIHLIPIDLSNRRRRGS